MAQMPESFAASEKLTDKAKDTVAYHIGRVIFAVDDAVLLAAGGFFVVLTEKVSQHDEIKENFKLPVGKKNVRAEQRIALAAAGEHTVDPGAKQDEHNARCQYVKNDSCTAPENFCAAKIEDRKKKHCAEQAHVAEAGKIKRFQCGKKLHAEQTRKGMGNTEQQRRQPADIQLVLTAHNAEESKRRSQSQKEPQLVFNDKVAQFSHLRRMNVCAVLRAAGKSAARRDTRTARSFAFLHADAY